MKKKAFTLIELIVVIAIICMLVAIVSKSAKKVGAFVNQQSSSSSAKAASSGFDGSATPKLTKRVTDYTGTLSAEQINQLEAKLEAYEKETTNQVCIVIIPTLDGKNLEECSLSIAEGNKLGQKGKDNGVLILLSMEERKLRIEVGYGLEGVLPDGLCGRIRDNEFVPNFKQGKFYEGLNNGLDKLFLAVKNEYTADSSSSGSSSESEESLVGLGFIGALVVGGIIVLVCCVISRVLGGIAGGIIGFLIGALFLSSVWAVIIAIIGFLVGLVAKDIGEGIADSGGGGWSSGGGSGSSGSSFSGGGGSFGGGGASGSW